MSTFYIGDDLAYDDVVVVTVGGEIDYGTSPRLKQRIEEHMKGDSRHLVLDLSWTTFVDSTAIGVMMGTANRLREDGRGTLGVVCSDERVLQIFQISGLESAVALYQTCDEAVAELPVAG
jgi:anti-sigma B factor antagonist